MPVRKIPKNYRNVTGILASKKSEGQAQFESMLERDFLTLLEFSPAVERFEVQPLTLTWQDGSRERHYTPDALAFFDKEYDSASIPMLYEIKYRSELREKWSELSPKFRAAVRFARKQGWRFKIMTEVEIRTPYLHNASFLLPFVRRGPPSADQMDILDRTLLDLRETTPEGLLQATCRDEWNRARLIPALWYLIGTFQFGTDLHTPLNMNSRIWINE